MTKFNVKIFGNCSFESRKVIMKQFKFKWNPETETWAGVIGVTHKDKVKKLCQSENVMFEIAEVDEKVKVKNILGCGYSMGKKDEIRWIETRK